MLVICPNNYDTIMKEPVEIDGNDEGERKRSDERRNSTNQQLSSGARHLDSISEVLTERRRRYALYYLQEREV